MHVIEGCPCSLILRSHTLLNPWWSGGGWVKDWEASRFATYSEDTEISPGASLNKPTQTPMHKQMRPLSLPCRSLASLSRGRLLCGFSLLFEFLRLLFSILLLQVIKMFWWLLYFFSLAFWIKTKCPGTLNTQDKCKPNLPTHSVCLSGMNHWSRFPVTAFFWDCPLSLTPS